MSSEQVAPWLAEIGRRAQVRQTGRPVPPITQGLNVAKELDERSAAKLEEDFRDAIRSSEPEDEYDLNSRILDAVTCNRLSSKQGVRLLRMLFGRNDGTPGFQRIDEQGEMHDVNRWGAA
jgi:hypothetical protein